MKRASERKRATVIRVTQVTPSCWKVREHLPREGQIRIRAEEVGPADRDNQAGRSAASNLSDIGSLRSEMELQRSQSPLTLQVKKD